MMDIFNVRWLGLFACLMSCALLGCDAESTTKLSQQDVQAIQSLAARVTALENVQKGILDRATQDKTDLILQRIDVTALKNEYAVLAPTSTAYQTLRSTIGMFAISMHDVQAYSTGTKFILRIGNPTSATILTPSIHLDWGVNNVDGTPFVAGAMSKDEKFVGSIYAGTWTDFSVVLEGVTPAKLGWVQISELKPGGLSLGQVKGPLN